MENDLLDIHERIKWLRNRDGLTQKETARKMGVAYTTFQKFELGNFPKRANLERIVNYYGCSKSWLLTGEGEPFPGQDMTFREQHATYPNQAKPLDFSLPEAMKMVTDVLTSGTSYATALYLNIQHFDRAIRAENRIAVLEEENKRLNSRLEDMETRLAAIEDRLPKGDQAGGQTGSQDAPIASLNGTTGT
ncbi:MAG: helix-turn-helix transcriptional regulator [Deltaproteobacteria bacterium]|nr:helix-turn-helix transcriptional regulator [Deltaproteobacteria bacterium]